MQEELGNGATDHEQFARGNEAVGNSAGSKAIGQAVRQAITHKAIGQQCNSTVEQTGKSQQGTGAIASRQ